MHSIVIFGATGDLAKKKLFPALHGIKNVKIVAVGRRPEEDFRKSFLPMTANWMCSVKYHKMELDDDEGYRKLEMLLRDTQPIYYLATPPGEFKLILEKVASNINLPAKKILIE